MGQCFALDRGIVRQEHPRFRVARRRRLVFHGQQLLMSHGNMHKCENSESREMICIKWGRSWIFGCGG
jgi:hypothetical protein